MNTGVWTGARVSHVRPETVAKAALLMDGKFPGWAQKVDTKTLDMMSLANCVIGQVAGYVWSQTIDQLFGDAAFDTERSLKEFGCSGADFADHESKPFWVDEINKRRQ